MPAQARQLAEQLAEQLAANAAHCGALRAQALQFEEPLAAYPGPMPAAVVWLLVAMLVVAVRGVAKLVAASNAVAEPTVAGRPAEPFAAYSAEEHGWSSAFSKLLPK